VDGVVLRDGEGEALFGGRIRLKATFDWLCMTETWYDRARPGADSHVHHHHADSFYVLEGEMAFLVGGEEHVVGPGGCVCAPPGVVHGFRSLSAARFLNFHTPDGGFAEHLRARNRGGEGGFDSEAVPPGGSTDGAVLWHGGEGEALDANNRVATIKIGREEIALIEFELRPGFDGPGPHTHDDQVDSFYVLEGEAEFQMGDETGLFGPGSFVSAPPGALHTFANGPGVNRVLNIHAPSAGFHEWLRSLS